MPPSCPIRPASVLIPQYRRPIPRSSPPSTSPPPRVGPRAPSRRRRRTSQSTLSPLGSITPAGSTSCPTATCWWPKPTGRTGRRTPRASKASSFTWRRNGPAPASRARTASRCCATPTATALRRRERCSCKDLNSPFGMALVGDDLYVANTDAVVRFPYAEGETQITAPGAKVADLPAGPDQPSLDQEHHRQPRRLASSMRPWAPTATSAENGMEAGGAPRGDLEDRSCDRAIAGVCLRPAQSQRHGLAAADRRAVDGGERARRARQRPRARLPDFGEGRRRSTAGRTAITASTSTPASSRSAPIWSPRRSSPDYALGNHTASLGLDVLPGRRRCRSDTANGAFIGQHGSWNRKPRSGYKVIFVPFADGQPGGTAGGRADRLRQRGR